MNEVITLKTQAFGKLEYLCFVNKKHPAKWKRRYIERFMKTCGTYLKHGLKHALWGFIWSALDVSGIHKEGQVANVKTTRGQCAGSVCQGPGCHRPADLGVDHQCSCENPGKATYAYNVSTEGRDKCIAELASRARMSGLSASLSRCSPVQSTLLWSTHTCVSYTLTWMHHTLILHTQHGPAPTSWAVWGFSLPFVVPLFVF